MIAVSTKVDVTGPDVAGSVGDGDSVLTAREGVPLLCPGDGGERKVETRDGDRSSPAETSIEAIWPGASPTVGGSGKGGNTM